MFDRLTEIFGNSPQRAPVAAGIDEVARRCRALQAENQHLKDVNANVETVNQELMNENTLANNEVANLQASQKKAKKMVEGLASERAQLQHDYHESQRARQTLENEASQLRNQLAAIKSSISNSTKVTNQITDDEVSSRFDQLFYAIQDFSITASREVSFDASRLHESANGWMAEHIMDVMQLPKSHHPYIIIALISRSLVARFSLANYFGVSSDSPVEVATYLADRFGGVNVTATKSWLKPTRQLLKELDQVSLNKADDALVDSAIIEMSQVFGAALPLDWNKKALQLRKIVKPAFDLFRALHSSNAVFDVYFVPAVTSSEMTIFRNDAMQAVHTAEAENELSGRPIQISVFPEVQKYGDEMGNNTDEMTVISKAKVVPQKKPRPLYASK